MKMWNSTNIRPTNFTCMTLSKRVSTTLSTIPACINTYRCWVIPLTETEEAHTVDLTVLDWLIINIASNKVEHNDIYFVQPNNRAQDFGRGERRLSQTRQLPDTAAVFVLMHQCISGRGFLKGKEASQRKDSKGHWNSRNCVCLTLSTSPMGTALLSTFWINWRAGQCGTGLLLCLSCTHSRGFNLANSHQLISLMSDGVINKQLHRLCSYKDDEHIWVCSRRAQTETM